MNIQELQSLVTPNLLKDLLSTSLTGDVQVELIDTKPADFPFLKEGASNNALFLLLHLRTTPANALPERLVLKAGTNVGGTAEREISFYRMASDRGSIPGVVECYGQAMLDHHDLGLMLLEHVDADAIAYNGPVEEHLGHYSAALRVLASLHAGWWDDPGLGRGLLAPQWTTELLDGVIPLAEAGLQTFIAGEGSLSAQEQALIQRVLSRASPLMTARAKTAPMCVTHGDAALWNFVLDRNNPTRTTLVDLQTWHVNPPAWDLAYMMHLLWPTDFRRQHGAELLGIYVEALAARGVTYASEDFERDFRLSIVGLFAQLFAYYQLGIWGETEVQERVIRLLTSFNELEVAALLEYGG